MAKVFCFCLKRQFRAGRGDSFNGGFVRRAWILLRDNQAKNEIAQANVSNELTSVLPPSAVIENNSVNNSSNVNALSETLPPQVSQVNGKFAGKRNSACLKRCERTNYS